MKVHGYIVLGIIVLWSVCMTKTIAFGIHKGGEGKSISCVNISVYLAYMGYKVLVVDADPQGTTTSGLSMLLGRDPDDTDFNPTLYEAIVEWIETEKPMRDVIYETSMPNLYLVPANENLADATRILEKEVLDMGLHPQTLIDYVLRPLIDPFDFVLIDTAGQLLNLLMLNGLYMADYVLVPMKPSKVSTRQIRTFVKTLQRIRKSKKRMGRDVSLLGFFFTFYRRIPTYEKAMYEGMRELYGNLVFKTAIPLSTYANESLSEGKPLLFYAPDSPPAQAYYKLTCEILEKLGEEVRRNE